MAIRGIVLWLLSLLLGGIPSWAAQVVVVTMDRLPVASGVACVQRAFAPAESAVALLVTRTAQEASLRVRGDAYLTVNAGRPSRLFTPLEALQADQRLNLTAYEPHGAPPPTLGALGDALHAAGLRTATFGSPEARALLMDSRGAADAGGLSSLAVSSVGPAGLLAEAATADVVAIDLTAVAQRSLEDAAAWLTAVHQGFAPGTRFLVCSLLAPYTAEVPWALGWVVAAPVPGNLSLLTSPSTRIPGVVANTDLTATILAWAEAPPTLGIGRPMVPVASSRPRQPVVAHLAALADGLHRRARWRPMLFLGYAIGLAVVLGGLALLRWRASPGRERAARAVAVAVAASWVLVACTGVWPTSLGALQREVLLGTVLVGGGLWLGRRAPVTTLWGCAGLIALLAGAALQDWRLFNQTSYLILNASRYYGLSNPSAGLVLVGGLCLAARGVGRWWSWGAVGALWFCAVWIFWSGGGANFGMGLSGAAMAVAATLINLSPQVRWRALLAMTLIGAVSLVGLLWLDVRLGGQSHIGRLLGEVHGQGWAPLLEIIARKGRMALKLIRTTNWGYVMLAGWCALALALRQGRHWWPDHPSARLLLASGLTGLVVSLLLNDSGVEPAAIFAACLSTSWSDFAPRR
jgi:hypothetical protein